VYATESAAGSLIDRLRLWQDPRPPVVDARIVLLTRPDGAPDIWSVLVNVATALHPTEWCLIGGQIVAFRLAPPRVGLNAPSRC
jgi:hypothetical protein